MYTPKHHALLAAGLLTLSLHSGAQAQDAGMRTLVPADPKAFYVDPALPHGAKLLDLQGNAKQPGSHLYRLRMPSGLKMPPHKYARDQMITVVKGTLWMGTGDRYNPMKMQELFGGSAYTVPAGTAVYNWARTEVILHVLTEGGVENPIEYINPDDDPRQQ